MISKIIEIERIGPVLFERSNRAKHLNISVKENAKVRVAVPKGISFEKAKNFTHSKIGWISKHLLKIQLRPEIRIFDKPLDKQAAKEFLEGRIKELADKFGFVYNKITIRNQKTRWGSCSGKNNINLNMQLMNIPNHLIDYVLLHELVHTIVKNHSPLFWTTLDRYVGNAKAIDKELKKYSLS
jgi:predicted metal-dependent hydrolase